MNNHKHFGYVNKKIKVAYEEQQTYQQQRDSSFYHHMLFKDHGLPCFFMRKRVIKVFVCAEVFNVARNAIVMHA